MDGVPVGPGRRVLLTLLFRVNGGPGPRRAALGLTGSYELGGGNPNFSSCGWVVWPLAMLSIPELD